MFIVLYLTEMLLNAEVCRLFSLFLVRKIQVQIYNFAEYYQLSSVASIFEGKFKFFDKFSLGRFRLGWVWLLLG